MPLSPMPPIKLALLVALSTYSCACTFACAPQEPASNAAEALQSDTATFKFAPQVGKTFEHTMIRTEEVQIVGTPMSQSEHWETTWRITVAQEVDLLVFQAEVRALKVSVNGAEVLKGNEVTDQGGKMDILFDKNGRVVDIRHTQTLTEVLLQVTPPAQKQAIAAMFSPDNLKMLFLQRANERADDLVGRSARVGEVWKGADEPGAEGHVSKELKVEASEGCGQTTCVRVSRTVEIAPDVVWSSARKRVDAYVMEQGGDPTSVKLTDADIAIRDEFLVVPHDMEFHSASFSQKATLSVTSPKGDLSVAFSVLRESKYNYALAP